jgi:diguanylate cyclase (GGDEF)-like protein|tara:strand:- start:3376 stop:5178 length:1803 start_codon:yes stop_codon:yes gene_type:complete
MIAALLPSTVAIVLLTQTAHSFLARMEQQRTIVAAAIAVERAVIDAETAQRGYLLSQSPIYREEYLTATKTAGVALNKLSLVARNAGQAQPHVDDVLRHASSELALLGQLANKGDDAALDVVRGGEGRFAAQELRSAVNALDNSLNLSFSRGASDVDQMLKAGQWFAIVGAIVGIAAILLALLILGRYLRSSLSSLLDAMHTPGDFGIPADVASSLTGEFRELGDTYNRMCGRMRAELAKRVDAEARIADLLDRSGEALADRQRVSEVLARISNRLPACLDQQELVALATRFIPQLFDIRSGALYFLSNSATVLSRVASWGDQDTSLAEFAPTKCWALRRGQQHHVTDAATDVTCEHLTKEVTAGYICVPLIAQGETVGLLYLESTGEEGGDDQRRELEDMRVLCENLALALVNLRLRESLRHQSLRDPLTGLHNRRYLDETIDLEFAKSRRNQVPVSLIMADIDHFKHVNDTHGHDAGDYILRKIAACLSANIRKGDVACRFGGEEFVILLPGLNHQEALERAEILREQISTLPIKSAECEVGQVTASFGVATFAGGEETPADVIKSADHALYEAKSAGRDRVRSTNVLDIVAPDKKAA